MTKTKTITTTPTLGECCPIFNPEKWDNKVFNWQHKKFLKAAVPALFHIPYTPMIAKKITKMMKVAEEQHKIPTDKEDILLLFMDPNPFKSEMYLSVTDEIHTFKNVTLSGTFESKVFKGDYKDVGKNIKLMKDALKKRGLEARNYFVHYAYCPQCSNDAGHNYAVIFAELDQ